MNFLNNMKVVRKLGLLALIAFLALGFIGYTGYYYLQQSNTRMNAMYAERLIPVKTLNEVSTFVEKSNAAIMELMITTDDSKNQELQQILEDRATKIKDDLDKIGKLPLDPKAKKLFSQVQTSRQRYLEARTKVIDLAMQNKNAEAYALYVASVDPVEREYINQITELSNHYTELSNKMDVDNQTAFEKAKYIMIGIFFLAFVILGLGGLFVTGSITRPLTTMVSACKEFAAGDFRDKPRKVRRKDEIGQVADALVDMRNSIRALLKQINVSTEQVAASSEELTASADQSAQAAGQVAGSITDVAHGMADQSAAVNDTSAIIQQMSASIQQIAANAQDVAKQSGQAANKANEGNRSIDKAVSQMSHIEQTVTASAGIVAKLGERSNEIGRIVDTIAGIAGQTNLLALNAAIEAARAGEQGRGFAVVADEVRKLAEQSQEAAKQIADLISEIQGDTNRAVTAMNDGTRDVKIGTEVVTISGQAFREITALVKQVSGQINEISAAIEQMAAGSQQIVGSVKRIDELSKKASGETQTVSAATEEQSASMEEIAASSQALAKLAMDLREAVGKFQV
ncbi:chemotaxis methyl-accepting receptor [Lucifera butyrica]|uniref:Chemotaxis methyl-accepting receptor n=2 Tax=Lucifera butyrica TaxID=1351585 RepID=A0A498RFH3_9FIRM|nr:chemotaxis methyl-accepting receptor [Lucifera butyrica]